MRLKFMGSGDRDTLLQSWWLGMCVAEGELGVPPVFGFLLPGKSLFAVREVWRKLFIRAWNPTVTFKTLVDFAEESTNEHILSTATQGTLVQVYVDKGQRSSLGI